jgi:arsenate reductase
MPRATIAFFCAVRILGGANASETTFGFVSMLEHNADADGQILSTSHRARPLNVLVLCTGNSARSIMAEALFNQLGAGRVRAYSAGSHPRGALHPLTLAELRRRGLSVDGLRSKGWEVFAASDAPRMDLVVTVCDSAAAEACPVWPGAPTQVHWGFPDPAAVEGDEAARRMAFAETFDQISARVAALCRLPLERMDIDALRRAVKSLRSE